MINIKKKLHKYKLKNKSYRLSNNYKITYGNFGLKSITNALITYRTIENIRRKLSKQFKKIHIYNKTKIYIKLHEWKPYTHKPMLSRMGKGCGAISLWKTFIRKRIVFIEFSTLEKESIIKKIVKKSVKNLPLKVVLSKKH